MSDQSIATIARDLAAALLAAAGRKADWSPGFAQRDRRRQAEHKAASEPEAADIAALQAELCAAYRAEIVETLRI